MQQLGHEKLEMKKLPLKELTLSKTVESQENY